MRAQNKPDRALRQASFVTPERFLTHFPARSVRSLCGSQLFSTAFPTGEGRGGTGPRLQGEEGWARSAAGSGQSFTDTPAAQAAPAPREAPQAPGLRVSHAPGRETRPGRAGPGRAVRAARGRRRWSLTGRSCPGPGVSCPQHTQGALSPRGHGQPGELPRRGFASCSPSGTAASDSLASPPSHRSEHRVRGALLSKTPSPEQYPGTATAGTTWMANTLQLPLAPQCEKGPQRVPDKEEHSDVSPDCSNFYNPCTCLCTIQSQSPCSNSYLRSQRIKEVLNLFWQPLFCQVAKLCQFIQ